MHTKVPKKTTLLRGEQSEPWISTPLSLERSERSSPFYIPLTGAHKSAKKNTTFDRRAKRALNKYPSLSQAKGEKFPFLYTPYWCTQICQKKHAFERWAERGLTNGCGHLSIYCISAINLKLYIPLLRFSSFFNWHNYSLFIVGSCERGPSSGTRM